MSVPPTITAYSLTDATMQDLPAFVLAKVKNILEVRHALEEDTLEEDSLEEEVSEEDSLCYGEVIAPLEEIVPSIMLWFPDRGRTVHSMYIGGASAWVRPHDTHFLACEAISDDLLPRAGERDPSIWWVVSDTEYARWPLVLRVSIIKDEIRRCP